MAWGMAAGMLHTLSLLPLISSGIDDGELASRQSRAWDPRTPAAGRLPSLCGVSGAVPRLLSHTARTVGICPRALAVEAEPGMAWQLAAVSSSQYQEASVSYTNASILVPT